MATKRFTTRARKIIEENREEWMIPHLEAMSWYEYRDALQEWVAERIADFSWIDSHRRSWDTGIENGTIDFDPGVEEEIVALYRDWMAHCMPASKLVSEALEHGLFNGADEFRGKIDAASEYVNLVARRAARERRMGLRGSDLSLVQAAKFAELDANHAL